MVEPSRWRPARRIEGQLQCRIRAHSNEFVLLRVSRCERSLCTAYGCVHGKTMRLDRRDGIRNNRWNGQYMCRWWCDYRADVPVRVRSRILHRRFRYDHVSAERSLARSPGMCRVSVSRNFPTCISNTGECNLLGWRCCGRSSTNVSVLLRDGIRTGRWSIRYDHVRIRRSMARVSYVRRVVVQLCDHSELGSRYGKSAHWSDGRHFDGHL